MARRNPVALHIVSLAACLQLLLSSYLSAEVVEFEGYQVQYAALPGSVLSESSARLYGISRSIGSGFVNVTVFKMNAGGSLEPRQSFIRGTIKNEMDEARPLEFERITANGSTSSIANFWYSPGKILSFSVEFIGDPNEAPLEFQFKKTLFQN